MTPMVLLLAFQTAMILAAVSDLFTMTIPNRLTALFAAGFVAVALLSGLPLEAAAFHVACGLAALVAGFALFSFGWIGGGDAKFFAATAMWLGPSLMLEYAMASAIYGGALTLALLAVRMWPLPAPLARQGWIARLHDRQSGIPYGIALALGGLMVASRAVWAIPVSG
ncbi:MAG: prepilin peptidase [Flavobacteriaceae bacterium]